MASINKEELILLLAGFEEYKKNEKLFDKIRYYIINDNLFNLGIVGKTLYIKCKYCNKDGNTYFEGYFKCDNLSEQHILLLFCSSVNDFLRGVLTDIAFAFELMKMITGFEEEL